MAWSETAAVAAGAYIALGLLLLLAEYLLLPADFRLGPGGPAGQLNLSRLLAYLVWLLLLAAFLIWRFGRRRPAASWRARLDLTRPGAAAIGWAAAGLLSAWVVSLVLVLVLSQLDLVDLNQRQRLGFSLRGGWSLVWAFLTLAVLVPLGEELLFRRWLWRRLAETAPAGLALPLASLIFGLAHLPPVLAAVDTTVFAIAAIIIYRRFGSLWLPVGMHAAKNGLALSLLALAA